MEARALSGREVPQIPSPPQRCEECEGSVSVQAFCIECNQWMCLECDGHIHSKGNRRNHKRFRRPEIGEPPPPPPPEEQADYVQLKDRSQPASKVPARPVRPSSRSGYSRPSSVIGMRPSSQASHRIRESEVEVPVSRDEVTGRKWSAPLDVESCPNRPCGFIGSSEQISEHRSQCEYELHACVYASCGCTVTGTKQILERHQELAAQQHMQIMNVKLNQVEAKQRIVEQLYNLLALEVQSLKSSAPPPTCSTPRVSSTFTPQLPMKDLPSKPPTPSPSPRKVLTPVSSDNPLRSPEAKHHPTSLLEQDKENQRPMEFAERGKEAEKSAPLHKRSSSRSGSFSAKPIEPPEVPSSSTEPLEEVAERANAAANSALAAAARVRQAAADVEDYKLELPEAPLPPPAPPTPRELQPPPRPPIPPPRPDRRPCISSISVGLRVVGTVAPATPKGASRASNANNWRVSTFIPNDGQLACPVGIAMDKAGNLYLADRSKHEIYKINSSGQPSLLAGGQGFGFQDGKRTRAKFCFPTGLAVDSLNVYIADCGNHAVRVITHGDGRVETLAGGTGPGHRDAPGPQAAFFYPVDLTVDRSRNVYVADRDNHCIRKISPDGKVTTLAGTGKPGFVDGPPHLAQFHSPTGVCIDAQGTLFIADSENHSIRRISDGQVSTLAPTNLPMNGAELAKEAHGLVDGHPNVARFHYPRSVAVDNRGHVFVADYANQCIRRINSLGHVQTVAGKGEKGFKDGIGKTAVFRDPCGLVVGEKGAAVYVCDQSNKAIRKISFIRSSEKASSRKA